MNKLTIFLACLSVSLAVALGIAHHDLHEARLTIDRQEAQLKELYGQVNELTVQYVGIVRRLQSGSVAK